MKLFLAMVLVLVSGASDVFASNSKTLINQMTYILQNKEVTEKIEKVTEIDPAAMQARINSFQGISHQASAKCIGYLNIYSLNFIQRTRSQKIKTCGIAVSIGECAKGQNPEQADMYADLSVGALRCQSAAN